VSPNFFVKVIDYLAFHELILFFLASNLERLLVLIKDLQEEANKKHISHRTLTDIKTATLS
jgi:hypothetical protein